MAIFNSYVSLPEGRVWENSPIKQPSTHQTWIKYVLFHHPKVRQEKPREVQNQFGEEWKSGRSQNLHHHLFTNMYLIDINC